MICILLLILYNICGLLPAFQLLFVMDLSLLSDFEKNNFPEKNEENMQVLSEKRNVVCTHFLCNSLQFTLSYLTGFCQEEHKTLYNCILTRLAVLIIVESWKRCVCKYGLTQEQHFINLYFTTKSIGLQFDMYYVARYVYLLVRE